MKLKQLRRVKKMQYITSVERIGIAKGRVEGRVEGGIQAT